MREYWKKVKQEAPDLMRRLIGPAVGDRCEDMRRAWGHHDLIGLLN